MCVSSICWRDLQNTHKLTHTHKLTQLAPLFVTPASRSWHAARVQWILCRHADGEKLLRRCCCLLRHVSEEVPASLVGQRDSVASLTKAEFDQLCNTVRRLAAAFGGSTTAVARARWRMTLALARVPFPPPASPRPTFSTSTTRKSWRLCRPYLQSGTWTRPSTSVTRAS